MGVEELTEAFLRAGRQAWPDVQLGDSLFATYLNERLDPAAAAPDLSRGLELFLACACVEADAAALQVVEERYLRQAPKYLLPVYGDPGFVDDVIQELRVAVLLGRESKPRIVEYSGKGSLEGWLRMVAVRLALNLSRSHRRFLARGAESRGTSARHHPDPELDYLKTKYRDDFSTALTEAIALRSGRDRTILRFSLIEGLTTAQIGAVYRVHATTVSRWLTSARQAMLEHMRDALKQRLKVTQSEFDSLMQILRSDLDIDLQNILSEVAL